MLLKSAAAKRSQRGTKLEEATAAFEKSKAGAGELTEALPPKADGAAPRNGLAVVELPAATTSLEKSNAGAGEPIGAAPSKFEYSGDEVAAAASPASKRRGQEELTVGTGDAAPASVDSIRGLMELDVTEKEVASKRFSSTDALHSSAARGGGGSSSDCDMLNALRD